MRILLAPKYSPRGASSRYRLWQYRALLTKTGHNVDAFPLLDDDYLSQLYENGRRSLFPIVKGYFRRLLHLLNWRRYDVVICEQEVLPYLPLTIDRLFRSMVPTFIVDYDDNAHFKYLRMPLLHDRIAGVMRAASQVVVGNRHLATFARRYSDSVTVIPTVVDTATYDGETLRGRTDGRLYIGWIGTPVTAKLLAPLVPELRQLLDTYPNLWLRFIGSGSEAPIRDSRVEILPWSQETEASLLAQCAIGIMPLPDDEFTRSKCGLKLIQYMACSMPVVASPVGVNVEIVEHGVNGFLADTPSAWYKRLDELVRQPNLRTIMGTAGRATIESRYSLSYGFSLWSQLLNIVPDVGSFHSRVSEQITR